MDNAQAESDRHKAVIKKALDFSASFGIIEGSLARGAGGRFVNAADLEAQRTAIVQAIFAAARATVAGGAAPKSSRTGKRSAKKSKEKTDREKSAALAKKRAEVSAALAESGDLSQAEFDALNAFRNGDAIDPATVDSLAQKGLLEYGTDGTPRTTVHGRGIITAANRGDVRSAKDRASNGRDRAAKTMEQAASKREQAASLQTQANDLEGQIASGEEQVQELTAARDALIAQSAADNIDNSQAVAAFNKRIRQQQAQQARIREKVNTLNGRIVENEFRAAELEARIGVDSSLVKAFFSLSALDNPFAPSIHQKSQLTFQRSINAAIRRYIWEQSDDLEFIESMLSAVRRGYTQAWRAGALECGIAPGEFTPEENKALEREITNQGRFILRLERWLAEKIENNDTGKRLTFSRQISLRAKLWGNRFQSVQNTAKTMACKDKKLEWVIDPTKDNCPTCLGLNGKVKRASFWRKADIQPQNAPNAFLDCEGWQCGCELLPTTKAVSRGRLPKKTGKKKKSWSQEMLELAWT